MLGLGDALSLAELAHSVYRICVDAHETKQTLKVVGRKMAALETLLRKLPRGSVSSASNHSSVAQVLTELDEEIKKAKEVVNKAHRMRRAIYILKAASVREELNTITNSIQFWVNSLQVGQIEGIRQTLEDRWAEQDVAAAQAAAQERKENRQLTDALCESSEHTRATRVKQIAGEESPAQLRELLLETQQEQQVLQAQIALLRDSHNSVAQAKAQQEAHFMEQLIAALQHSQISATPYPNAWYCPVTNELMTDPCVGDTICHHTMERSVWEWAIQQKNKTCPLCGSPIRSNVIAPNVPLRESMEELRGVQSQPAVQTPRHEQSQPAVPPSQAPRRPSQAPRRKHSQKATVDAGTGLTRLRACRSANDFDGIVKIMTSARSNSHIQQEACDALLDMSRDGQNDTLIANAGGVQAIVEAMSRHKGVVEVQEQGCGALCNLATNTQNRTLIANAGGIPTIVEAMTKHGGVALVQEKGCGALWGLTHNNANNKTLIANEGGITAIVGAMTQHRGVVNVQVHGCGALRNLAADNDNNKTLIANAGGIPSIVEAMAEHIGSVAVQEQGCGVLLNLACNNAVNKSHIARSGGVRVAQAAMRQFPNNPEIQENGGCVVGWCQQKGNSKRWWRR